MTEFRITEEEKNLILAQRKITSETNEAGQNLQWTLNGHSMWAEMLGYGEKKSRPWNCSCGWSVTDFDTRAKAFVAGHKREVRLLGK